jgi:integrase
MFKISKRAVDALAPRATRYKKSFGGGLTVRVEPSGVKTFLLEYRPGAGGRSAAKQAITLGRYGPMTVDQARDAAFDARARIRLGDDPAREKKTQRAALTVAGLVRAFDEGHIAKLKPTSRESYANALAKLTAAHGSVKSEALTRTMVGALHRRLKETPYAANRMLAATSKLYAWAEAAGLVPEGCPNPARKITRYRERARERFLSSEEFARLGDALAEAESAGKTDLFAAAAIRLIALTGARLREILHAQWSQVDIDRGFLFLPDSKTGRKPVYLSAAALAVLAVLPRLEGNRHIIPGMKEGAPRQTLHQPWALVTRAAGLGGLRIHDLRHSFAAFGAGRSLGLPIIGKLLGHTQPSTTARYAHLHADPLRSAADAIGAEIHAAMTRRDGAAITRFRK